MKERLQKWHDAMVAKGHKPQMADCSSEPMLDIFVVDVGFHNGPGCLTCHWSCCMHCKGIDDIPECDQRDGEKS